MIVRTRTGPVSGVFSCPEDEVLTSNAAIVIRTTVRVILHREVSDNEHHESVE
ncbi:MAG: hypothetical protein LUQ36_06235 [Methanoregula sp.]|nr:hypothetical protein [Methanoregula sp.]